MKSRYISSVVIVIIGATIGMTLAYFSTSSADAVNLFAGAVIGALVGLYFAVPATVPADGPTSGRQPGIG